ncbi:MAG: SpoIIE family protein phosphatase [Salinivirgaceae bacterium]|jgi:ligand-binding sensor domain-containing protein/serine phosphatase RsbU (regulator of sigma subunit)|nr:SpoIIE family protein phosphatase [Salinivirgaceae bacterium]
MIKHAQLLFLFFTLVIGNLNAQSYTFDYWGVQDGLSQSVVNCIYQDSEGFIWIGTQNGLNQFNGYTFKTHLNNPNDTNTISGNWIYDIVEDQKGFIWVATEQGVNRFHKQRGAFERLDHTKGAENRMTSKVVYGLGFDDDGDLILNALPNFYVYHFDNKKLESVPYNGEDDAITNQKIPVFREKSGRVWIGTKRGVFIYKDGKITPFRYNELGNIPEVTSIYQDRQNRIWIGTKLGLYAYDKDNNTFNAISSFDGFVVRSTIEDSKGGLWVGTESGLFKGLPRTDNGNLVLNNLIKIGDLGHEIVYDLLIDHSENLWVGTLNGLNKTNLKPRKFRTYRKSLNPNSIDLIDNVIASIYKVNDSVVWVGNWGKGLNVFNRNSKEVQHYSTAEKGNRKLTNDFVHVIFKDHMDYYWLGTRDGLLVYDERAKEFGRPDAMITFQNMPNLGGHRIYNIIQDNLKFYWIATQKGVYCIDYITGQMKHYAAENEDESERLTNNLVYDIIQDDEGLFWIATSNGLNVLNRKTSKIKQYVFEPNNNKTIGENFIVSLCQINPGFIWIGTQSGLFKYDKKSGVFEYYNQQYNIPAKLIYEILADKNNNLWLASQEGLAFFNTTENQARNYTVEEGLQSTEFNLNAAHLAGDGEMFFGGMNGFNSFYPDSLYINSYIPPVVISNFTKRNNSKLYNVNVYDDNIALKHNDYEVFIEFAALEYTNPGQNEYAYKMDGITNGWIEIGNRRYVNFSNLSPGKYSFNLIGSNNDGVWNKKGRNVQITVSPPWYRTTLAYITYVILLITAIFIFIKTREKKLIRDRKVLEEKVKERTKELEQQKQIVEKSHREITSSINYASRIQQAMMPHKEQLDALFSDYCLFYKPRDVVSGDFYWVRRINHYVVFAVGDCTGHGVPGAMVSMLGISAINEIIRRREIISSAQVLDHLRDEVKTSLRQKDYKAGSKDGLEIAFCIYDTQKNVIDYSGAQNPLWILKENNGNPCVEEIKGTPNPISVYVKEIPFKAHQITPEPGDFFFIFSDGMIDQFNGETDEKFKKRRLKELLISNYGNTLESYNQLLEDEFQKWKGDSVQIDDILVMGVSIDGLK